MKRFILSLGVAVAAFGFAHKTNAQTPFEYSTKEQPKWYIIKCTMLENGTAGYATGKVMQTKGMGKNLTFEDYNNTSFQMFRFEKIAEQDSFKIINRKFEEGCLLSEGTTASTDKIYNTAKPEYVAWALEKYEDAGNGVQYRIVADDGPSAKDPSNEDAPTYQILHAQNTGRVIVSWDSEYSSASTWVFEPIVRDPEAFTKAIDVLSTAISDIESKIGSGVGQYPKDQFDELLDFYVNNSVIDPTELSEDEYIAFCDNVIEKVARIKDSRGQIQPYLPEASTATEPIWYVLRSEASDGRNGRVVAKQTDRILRADETFKASNDNQFWRVQLQDGLYSLINKAGGAIAGTMEGANFKTTENQDTMCFDFKIVSPDPFNDKMNTKIVGLVNTSGQPFHQGNGGFDWKVITAGLTDNGSFFTFTKASDIVSDPIVTSTEAAPIWYYIKGKRQADAETKNRPYLTSFGATTDTIYTRVNAETGAKSEYTYRIFGRSESMLQAAGDSAMWRFEEVTIKEMSKEDPSLMVEVPKMLIINKLTNKCLNAYNHGNSKPLRFVDRTEQGDTVYPYWETIDKTKNLWSFVSKNVKNVDGVASEEVTYANFDNGPGLVMYNGANDAGGNFWLELANGWVASTPETSTQSIKVFVNNGFITITGTDAKPTLFTITGAQVDPAKKLAAGVYIVNVDGQSTKVVVTK